MSDGKKVVLYKDKYVRLTATTLKVYHCYFLGVPRTVAVADILGVSPAEELGLRAWDRENGRVSYTANIMWSADWRRGLWHVRQRDEVVLLLRGQMLRLGFSLHDRPQFLAALDKVMQQQPLLDDITLVDGDTATVAASTTSNNPETGTRRYLN